MKLLDFIKDKWTARKVVKQIASVRELAQMNANGAANTFVSAKERDRRKNRKKIAKKSRQKNRK